MRFFITSLSMLLTCHVMAQTVFFEGTWKEALKEAEKQNKYLFIDCYTDWCVWCKVADKNTFPAEAVADVLNKNFVSVKVDMERGEGVALGAKYRVLGYPSYLMFTPTGKLAGKMFGYIEDPKEFASQVELALNTDEHPDYPSLITDDVPFPDFYAKSFVNRDTDEKRKQPDADEVEKWLDQQSDLLNEASWSVMYKFPLSEKQAEKFLADRKKYAARYGKVEVDEKISGIAYQMLQDALKTQDEADLERVIAFADEYIDEDKEASKSMYRMKFCEGKGDWSGYVECVQKLIDFYGFENFLGGINNYSWSIYLNADNPEVVKTASEWMSKVVQQDPQYMYLDTYAALLFKSGRYDEAANWAEKAIEVGKASGENVEETEALQAKIAEAKGKK